MKRRITLRSLLGIVILGSLAGVAVLIWRAAPPASQAPPPSANPDPAADLKLDRVHYTETREGVKEWELEAASAVYFKEQNSVALENIQATFYGKEKETYLLVGERGTFNTQTKVIEVQGGVKIQSSTGYRMKTRSLKYQTDRRELSTSDPVEMTGPDLQVKGQGMVVDLKDQRLRILGGVTTTLSSSEGKNLTSSAM